MLDKSRQTLKIETQAQSHEECFIDTHVGVALTFRVDETQYVRVYRRLLQIQNKMKALYPSLENELNCGIHLHDYPTQTTNISISHEVTFQRIRNDKYPSLVLNVAITGASAYAKMVFEEFKHEFLIIDCNDKPLITAQDVVKNICDSVEQEFYFMIDAIDTEGMEDMKCFDFHSALMDDRLEDCVFYVSQLNNDEYIIFTKAVSNEFNGEFGMDYTDGLIKICDINPLNNSVIITDTINAQCVNIKYNDLIKYIKE